MKVFYSLIAIFCFALCNAQAENPLSADALQVKPEYPGGIKAFYNYVSQSFRTPDVKEDMDARIVVSFVVERDGTISDVKILKNPGYGMGEEAVRVIKNCPEKWVPGYQNGKPVRANYVLPIMLKIKADNKDEENGETKPGHTQLPASKPATSGSDKK